MLLAADPPSPEPHSLMTNLLVLIPAALFLGLLGLAAYLWALKSGQFEDLEGAAARILLDDEEDNPDDAS